MTNSRTYIDSNVLVYAFCEQPDNEILQQKSVEIISSLIEKNSVCLSNLVICEFAFILKRLKESNDKINRALEVLKQFVSSPEPDITKRLIEILSYRNLFANSFDCYHLSLAETMNCSSLLTFDKDFEKMKTISKIEIIIL